MGTDADALERAIAAADPGVLAATVGYLSGDLAWARSGPGRPDVVQRARTVLPPWIGGGRAVPGRSDDVVQACLDLCAGTDVPPEYVPLARDQMGLDAKPVATPAVPPPEGFRALIIGAGISGICASIALSGLGVDHVVVDDHDEPGGTWLVNRYPGCGVDTANHLYSYSFALNEDWTHHYSGRDEVLAYVQRVAADHGVPARTRFGCRVEAIRWRPDDQCWDVEIASAGGHVETVRANVVISAVGILSQPSLPTIDGIDRFEGPYFHSSRWDPAFDPTGKRVAVIGVGASANQIVPAIAPVAERVVVFQRSPHWMAPNENTFRAVDDDLRWLFANVPSAVNWFRFKLFWTKGDGIFPTLRKDPQWPHPERAVSAGNDRTRETLTAHIESVLGDRPDLLAKVVPSFPPYGKRMLLDHDWYATLRRPDVELVVNAIDRVDGMKIVTAAGSYDVDAIVAATGFTAAKVLWPLRVYGRSGRDVVEGWRDDPRAYLGVAMRDCPNLFAVYGPNSNLAHGGSAYFVTECQVHYIAEVVRLMIERGWGQVEVREAVHDAYNAAIDREVEQYVWTHPGMDSWYKNDVGRITTNLPWRLVDYWHRTREVDERDFDTAPRRARAASGPA